MDQGPKSFTMTECRETILESQEWFRAKCHKSQHDVQSQLMLQIT